MNKQNSEVVLFFRKGEAIINWNRHGRAGFWKKSSSGVNLVKHLQPKDHLFPNCFEYFFVSFANLGTHINHDFEFIRLQTGMNPRGRRGWGGLCGFLGFSS